MPRRRRAVLAIAVLLVLFTTLSANAQSLETLTVIFLNVGQGDAELLRGADGFDALIDGGPPAAGPTVVAYLHQQGVDSLEVVVASHSDADHIGGLVNVLEDTGVRVDALVLNGYTATSDTWGRLVAAANARGLTPTLASYPDEYQWGNAAVHVLNPVPGLTNPDPNDASLVLRVDHGAVRLLFTGDISSEVEADVLARGTPVAADVLKVAHHGSGYSSSSAFLNAVGARDAVIEVGRNSYGHPAPSTLERLAQAGAVVWRTDQDGNVTLLSDGGGYRLSAQFTPAPPLWWFYLPAIQNQSPP